MSTVVHVYETTIVKCYGSRFTEGIKMKVTLVVNCASYRNPLSQPQNCLKYKEINLLMILLCLYFVAKVQ